MRRTLSFPALCLATALLHGCATHLQDKPTDDDAVYAVTTISINKLLRIRPDRANEYIQDGAVRPYDEVTDYYPYCEISLDAIQPNGFDIKPGSFTVSRIYRDTTLAGRSPLQVAGGDWGFIMSSTWFLLQSDEQPGVRALICERLDESFRASHLTLEEIRLTLGGLAGLNTAPAP